MVPTVRNEDAFIRGRGEEEREREREREKLVLMGKRTGAE